MKNTISMLVLGLASVALGIVIFQGGRMLYDYVNGTEEPPLPKVGECYEDYFNKMKEESYQIKKVIAVDPESEYDTIRYVYTFPNNPEFKHGQWYEIPTLTSESKRWFFGVGSKHKTVNKIECPW